MLCRHCQRRKKSRARGLCWACARDPEVSALYPRPEPVGLKSICRECGEPMADMAPVCGTCNRPESVRAEYHARIRLYQERATAEKELFPTDVERRGRESL